MSRLFQHQFTTLVLPALSCVLFSVNSAAQDDFFGDISTQSDDEISDKRLEFKGFYQQHFKYGIADPDPDFLFERDEAGLSQVRSDFFVEFENKFSDEINLRFSTKAEVETYRWRAGDASWNTHNERLFIRDAFIDVTLFNNHWVRLGHQLFSWGESEALSVIDVLSLRDQRAFGQAELQDIREQIIAMQYSLPVFSGKLNLITSYDAGHNRYAQSDDEFYPYIALKGSAIRFEQMSVNNEFEFAAKYDYQFNGGDFSIVIADTNDNDFALQASETDPTLVVQSQERVGVFGVSANRVLGSWLFKGEVSQFYNQPVNAGLTHYKSDQLRGAFGLEYSGIVDWFFSYEINVIKIQDTPSEFEQNDSKPGHTLHIRHSALHDRLQQDLWYFDFLDNQGSITRWDISYEWSDAATLALGFVLYDTSEPDSRLFPFRNHDSLNFSTTFHF